MTPVRVSLCLAVGLLAGCATSEFDRASPTRHLSPLPIETVRALKAEGMTSRSPMLVRVYKKESELEVWKQAADGRYKPFRTYKICRWSGDLGPKVKEGDKQAPEGFYTVTPAQMNPRSNYYLSFNIGFPNAFDRSHGRTGKHLMVHGDCLSAGCYAMTDEQMKEIYALARESFAGGQAAIQLQAYPFRMTARNLAEHRADPNMPFWKNLKEGSDHFEITRQEPRVAVCDRKYVFNPGDAISNARFSSRRACPPFRIDESLAAKLAAKQEKDAKAVKVAITRLEEERKAAIEAAKPNPVLSTLARGARPAVPAKARTKDEAKAEAKAKGGSTDKEAVAEAPPAVKSEPEDRPGTMFSRFLARVIDRPEDGTDEGKGTDKTGGEEPE